MFWPRTYTEHPNRKSVPPAGNNQCSYQKSINTDYRLLIWAGKVFLWVLFCLFVYWSIYFFGFCFAGSLFKKNNAVIAVINYSPKSHKTKQEITLCRK